MLGFPANDFAGQEPRSDDEIAAFCKANYGVSFAMFSKTRLTGERANPLYRALTAAAGAPEWNYNKYLFDRRGASWRGLARGRSRTIRSSPGASTRCWLRHSCSVRLRTYVPLMEQRISRRLQGDIGERSALCWLVEHDAKVYLPFGHSPDVDLVADFHDRLIRVQVKTTTVFRNQRWAVSLATRGGN